MIKVQVISFKYRAAVLAGIPVALEHIVPRKLDLFLWQALEKQKHDDSRDADAHRNRANHFRLGIRLREILPAKEIVRQKVIPSIR